MSDTLTMKCLSYAQVKSLREVVKQEKEAKTHSSMRDWFLIELGLYSGMRVFEMAKLHPKEAFMTTDFLPFIEVMGKRRKERTIYMAEDFKKVYHEFLVWKKAQGETDTFLFWNPQTKKHLTSRALQKSFKKLAQKAGLPAHFSIHALRHNAEYFFMPSRWIYNQCISSFVMYPTRHNYRFLRKSKSWSSGL